MRIRWINKGVKNIHYSGAVSLVEDLHLIPICSPQPSRHISPPHSLLPPPHKLSPAPALRQPTLPIIHAAARQSPRPRIVAHRHARRIPPSRSAAKLVRQPPVLRKRQGAERGTGPLEPVPCHEAACEAGRGGEEARGGVDEVDCAAGLVVSEVVGSGEADDARPEDDGRGHVTVASLCVTNGS